LRHSGTMRNAVSAPPVSLPHLTALRLAYFCPSNVQAVLSILAPPALAVLALEGENTFHDAVPVLEHLAHTPFPAGRQLKLMRVHWTPAAFNAFRESRAAVIAGAGELAEPVAPNFYLGGVEIGKVRAVMHPDGRGVDHWEGEHWEEAFGGDHSADLGEFGGAVGYVGRDF
ncbi:MAG: hypothetical protein WCC64_13005, partial [Aliidongia sp.]